MMWPFMFQLNEKNRPLKFLMVLLFENLILTCINFADFKIQDSMDENHTYLLLFMIITSIVGALFLYLYSFKPPLSDQVTRHDDLVGRQDNQISYRSECSGVYYEFCDLVFILPEPAQIADDLRLVRQAYS